MRWEMRRRVISTCGMLRRWPKKNTYTEKREQERSAKGRPHLPRRPASAPRLRSGQKKPPLQHQVNFTATGRLRSSTPQKRPARLVRVCLFFHRDGQFGQRFQLRAEGFPLVLANLVHEPLLYFSPQRDGHGES